MPTTDKSALIAVTETEFAKLQGLIQPIPVALALRPDAQDISIKDIVAHRAHWIDLFLVWYADGQAGRPVHFPAQGYKWNELPRYNADLRTLQKNMDWPSAQETLATSHGKLLNLINKLEDCALYTGPMKGGKNAWTTGRWAEAAGPSHYRSATKYIRQRLKILS